MADKAREWTDKELEKMERKIAKIYEEAQSGIREKWDGYMERAEKRVERYQKAVDKAIEGGNKDEIKTAKNALKKAEKNVTIADQYYREMVDETTTRLANTNQIAIDYMNDQLPKIYSCNYNDKDPDAVKLNISYSIRNEATVKRMIKEGDVQLPYKKLDIPKDKRWNTKQLNSQVLQGILQGEDMRSISKRILPIVDNNKSAAVRNARTMVTGAENRGKSDRFHTLQDKGAIIKKVWIATPDGRTRDWHLSMDGQEVELDEDFIDGNGNELSYPGDPDGEPETVYNCRCSMVSNIVGFRKANGEVVPIEDYDEGEEMHDEQIEREKERREQEKPSKEEIERYRVVDGKDISATWERRPSEFAFEIEDVINAQGFDGLPRVVSAEEFDELVKQANGGNGFIAQRTYSAPNQETLDAYRDQLYNGKWYVDCSNGGAALGRGMYAVYSNGTEITEYMEREINGYANRRGIEYHYVETFTLAKDAKTITPNEIFELRNTYREKIMAEFKEKGGWINPEALKWAEEHDMTSLDDGAFAALMGYDAILSHGLDDYAVVLNRTKVIFKRG